MLTVYKEWCIANNKKPVERILFCKIMDEENISIHMPRKYQWDLCCGYKVGSVSQDIWKSY